MTHKQNLMIICISGATIPATLPQLPKVFQIWLAEEENKKFRKKHETQVSYIQKKKKQTERFIRDA